MGALELGLWIEKVTLTVFLLAAHLNLGCSVLLELVVPRELP